MKIKDITLQNFSKYDSVTVSFDESVTYLIGKNGAGKTTLGITGVHFMFQGIAEKATGGNSPLIGERFRFIGPKAATAKGEMTLYDEKTMAEIKVFRKLTKTGTELSFLGPEGLDLDQKWLTDLFNVFLIAPKKFTELSPKEQANALGIDTGSFDTAIAALKAEHTALNRELKAFGDLQPMEEVTEVRLEVLQLRKDTIRKELNEAFRANQLTNKATRQKWEEAKSKIDEEVAGFNQELERVYAVRKDLTDLRDRLQDYRARHDGLDDLVDFSRLRDQIAEWIRETPVPRKVAAELYPKTPVSLADAPDGYAAVEDELVYILEMPDDRELQQIDQEIFRAGETNKQYLLYTQHVEKIKAKEAKEKELADNKAKQTAKEKERAAFIASFKFPFSNISVGDDGELLLAGKPIKEPYFSTGEILKIVPILLSTSNPDLKYVFLQDFNLMDEEKQAEVSDYLIGKGFQLVVEMVGKKKITDKNCILLKDNIVVEDYEQINEPQLSI